MRETDMGSYSVKIIESARMSRLRYVEGSRSLAVEAEMVTTPATIGMNATAVRRWDAPHGDEPIDDGDRHRIIENIQHALEQMGFDLQVVWPFGDRMADGTWRWSTDGQAPC
jgi:hypothetical protein